MALIRLLSLASQSLRKFFIGKTKPSPIAKERSHSNSLNHKDIHVWEPTLVHSRRLVDISQ